MPSATLEVHGEAGSQSVDDLIKRLERMGYDVEYCISKNSEPVVQGPNGERVEGLDIERTFFSS